MFELSPVSKNRQKWEIVKEKFDLYCRDVQSFWAVQASKIISHVIEDEDDAYFSDIFLWHLTILCQIEDILVRLGALDERRTHCKFYHVAIEFKRPFIHKWDEIRMHILTISLTLLQIYFIALISKSINKDFSCKMPFVLLLSFQVWSHF